MGTRIIFDELLARGAIDVRRGAIFDVEPDRRHPINWDRIEGMMLGLAIGDSLDRQTESMTPRVGRAFTGEVRDYPASAHANGRRVGTLSDDTQLES